MNLSQLKSQFAVLVPDFPLSYYEAEVTRFFNQAQKEVADKNLIIDKSYALSNVDFSEYNLPSNFIEIRKDGVFIDGKQINPITLGELVRLYGTEWQNLDKGTPKHYLREGWTIKFIPDFDTDDKEILIYFWGYANDLSQNDDVPFTTGNTINGYDYHNHLRSFDELLIEYAVGMAKFSLGFYSTTQTALTNFYTLLTAKVNKIKKREDLEKTQVEPDPYLLKKMQQRRY